MKKYFLIFINLLFIFSIQAEEDPTSWTNYSSKWFFSEIKSEKSSNIEFKKNDYLLINSDNTFEYNISKKNLFAKGTWELTEILVNNIAIGNTLIFNYSLPSDTSREYLIDYTKEKLILIENNVNYIFLKTPKIAESKPILTNILRGFLGLISLIFLAFLFSRDKKNINWSLVTKGLLIQLILAILILKVPFIQNIFEWISSIFVIILQNK